MARGIVEMLKMPDNRIQDTRWGKLQITMNKLSPAIFKIAGDNLCIVYCNLLVSRILYHASKIRESKARAQSITEYTVFITVVVLALLAMQIYFKRGIQGKIRDMVSYIGTESYNPNLTYANSYSDALVISESNYTRGVSSYWSESQQNSTTEQITYPEATP